MECNTEIDWFTCTANKIYAIIINNEQTQHNNKKTISLELFISPT